MFNKNNANIVSQKTLKAAIPYVGIGLHTGVKVSMVVKPAAVNSGINFIRKDVPSGEGMIAAHWYNVVDTQMSTMIGNEYKHTINTVEHLMAAFRGCGIDNAIVEIDGPEVPIMDGSSAPFVATIEHVGTVSQSIQRHAIWIHRPVEVRDGDKFAILMPSNTPRITAEIAFDNPAIGTQTYSVELINEAFHNQVSRARTFGFKHQIDDLQKRGLIKGGSLHNAILVDGDRIINKEGLRYDDEFVRHKILDCLGDLALAGVPILGHYYARKPGHELNNALMHKLFDERGAWSYTTVDDFEALMGIKIDRDFPEPQPVSQKQAAAQK